MTSERHKPKGEADSSDAPPRDGAARSSAETAVMAEERRSGVIQAGMGDQPGDREESRMTCKAYDIPKALVWEAWLHVRANQGAAGIDAETIERFETKLVANLYKLWNRMSSGSYFPPAVRAVPIPKKSGASGYWASRRRGWRQDDGRFHRIGAQTSVAQHESVPDPMVDA